MYHTDPRIPAKETLATMYDFPSEYPQDLGLPDEFHLLQPKLLTYTFSRCNYPGDQVFVASDLNLYYETRNPL
jgi:Uma2 family endonuclease